MANKDVQKDNDLQNNTQKTKDQPTRTPLLQVWTLVLPTITSVNSGAPH